MSKIILVNVEFKAIWYLYGTRDVWAQAHRDECRSKDRSDLPTKEVITWAI